MQTFLRESNSHLTGWLRIWLQRNNLRNFKSYQSGLSLNLSINPWIFLHFAQIFYICMSPRWDCGYIWNVLSYNNWLTGCLFYVLSEVQRRSQFVGNGWSPKSSNPCACYYFATTKAPLMIYQLDPPSIIWRSSLPWTMRPNQFVRNVTRKENKSAWRFSTWDDLPLPHCNVLYW